MRRKLKITIFILAMFGAGFIMNERFLQIFLNRSPEPAQASFVKTGKASWYSRRSPGINKRTANNEIFNDTELTAAMWGVPFNQKVRVTNIANGKSVVVRVNDRGPHKRYARRGRIIDLTKRAFQEIAPTKRGLVDISLELL